MKGDQDNQPNHMSPDEFRREALRAVDLVARIDSATYHYDRGCEAEARGDFVAAHGADDHGARARLTERLRATGDTLVFGRVSVPADATEELE